MLIKKLKFYEKFKLQCESTTEILKNSTLNRFWRWKTVTKCKAISHKIWYHRTQKVGMFHQLEDIITQIGEFIKYVLYI